jgi:hypothetical protein
MANIFRRQAVGRIKSSNLIRKNVTAGSEQIASQFFEASTQSTIVASATSFSITGVASSLKVNRVLSATVSTFAITGNNAIISKTFTLTTVKATFSISGISNNLLASRKLTTTVTPFTETGISVNLLRALRIINSVAVFTITGKNNNLLSTRKVIATVTPFALTGISSGLTASRKLTSSVTTFSYTGISANLAKNRILSASSSSFVFTGKNATLTYISGVSYSILAGTASFISSFKNASFSKAFSVLCEPGDFYISLTIANYTMLTAPATESMLTEIIKIDSENSLASTAPVKRIEWKNPKGKTGFWDVTIIEGTSILVYHVKRNDIIPGRWKLRVIIETDTETYYSEPVYHTMDYPSMPLL